MKPLIFNAVLYDVRIKRNGGRIQFDFGLDALDVINEISSIGAGKDCNFQLAIMQIDPSKFNSLPEPDENGEIPLDYPYEELAEPPKTFDEHNPED